MDFDMDDLLSSQRQQVNTKSAAQKTSAKGKSAADYADFDDDFLKGWKPTNVRGGASLDFDDEPASTTTKTKFKMDDKLMDFDFEGGLDKFDINISGLDSPEPASHRGDEKKTVSARSSPAKSSKSVSLGSLGFNDFTSKCDFEITSREPLKGPSRPNDEASIKSNQKTNGVTRESCELSGRNHGEEYTNPQQEVTGQCRSSEDYEHEDMSKEPGTGLENSRNCKVDTSNKTTVSGSNHAANGHMQEIDEGAGAAVGSKEPEIRIYSAHVKTSIETSKSSEADLQDSFLKALSWSDKMKTNELVESGATKGDASAPAKQALQAEPRDPPPETEKAGEAEGGPVGLNRACQQENDPAAFDSSADLQKYKDASLALYHQVGDNGFNETTKELTPIPTVQAEGMQGKATAQSDETVADKASDKLDIKQRENSSCYPARVALETEKNPEELRLAHERNVTACQPIAPNEQALSTKPAANGIRQATAAVIKSPFPAKPHDPQSRQTSVKPGRIVDGTSQNGPNQCSGLLQSNEKSKPLASPLLAKLTSRPQQSRGVEDCSTLVKNRTLHAAKTQQDLTQVTSTKQPATTTSLFISTALSSKPPRGREQQAAASKEKTAPTELQALSFKQPASHDQPAATAKGKPALITPRPPSSNQPAGHEQQAAAGKEKAPAIELLHLSSKQPASHEQRAATRKEKAASIVSLPLPTKQAAGHEQEAATGVEELAPMEQLPLSSKQPACHEQQAAAGKDRATQMEPLPLSSKQPGGHEQQAAAVKDIAASTERLTRNPVLETSHKKLQVFATACDVSKSVQDTTMDGRKEALQTLKGSKPTGALQTLKRKLPLEPTNANQRLRMLSNVNLASAPLSVNALKERASVPRSDLSTKLQAMPTNKDVVWWKGSESTSTVVTLSTSRRPEQENCKGRNAFAKLPANMKQDDSLLQGLGQTKRITAALTTRVGRGDKELCISNPGAECLNKSLKITTNKEASIVERAYQHQRAGIDSKRALKEIYDEIKRQNEEAQELLIRAITTNNLLRMLDNPMVEAKMQKLESAIERIFVENLSEE